MKKIIDEHALPFLLFLTFFIISLMYGVVNDTIKEIEINGLVTPIYVPHKIIKKDITGTASFYDYQSKSGWSSVGHLVCATRNFERYAIIKVTNLDNGKTVICKKTDYGPDVKIHPDRVVDLSSTAFMALAPLSVGLIKNVKIEKVK